MKKIAFILSLLGMVGCNEYWWTRGQPPSVKELVERAQDRFNSTVEERALARSDFAPAAQKLRNALIQALHATSKSGHISKDLIKDVEVSFIEMEGKLSVGSRAAYGELCNQIRAFANKVELGEQLDSSAFGLFASRSIFFLTSELKVPAPSF